MALEQMQIVQRPGDDAGKIELQAAGTVLGTLEYRWVEGVMHIDDTFVAPRLRGKGLARMLVLDAVRMAREDEFRIQPNCSYVRSLLLGLGEAVEDVLWSD